MKKIFYLFFTLFFLSCVTSDLKNNSLQTKFNDAKKSFESEKFSKAKEQFQYIIFNNPGSSLATKSQFYLAESYFNLENYNQASIEYDKFNMISQNSELIAKSKFLTCKCLYLLSSDSNKDQGDTQFTIDRIQLFLEEYPNTGHKSECEDMISELRNKLAIKDIDSGKLYLRMEKYQSALIYFELVLSEFWDTSLSDEAIYYIILTHILSDDLEQAKRYYENNKANFKDTSFIKKSRNIIKSGERGEKMKIFFEAIN